MLRGCGNNHGALAVLQRLEVEFPRLVVRVEPCLKKCGPCRERPFVLLDGEFFGASDPDELYREVKARLAARR